jgi:hypothetical protein
MRKLATFIPLRTQHKWRTEWKETTRYLENATMFNMSQDGESVVAAAESLTDGKRQR